MPVYTDMTGRSVEIPALPQRIVSVVPSQTELLHDLGLEEEVIGITKFCVHPDIWFLKKTRIGGTKNLNIEKILSLRPDLILANKEENTQAQIEQLATHVPVWISDIGTVYEAMEMIRSIGMITGRRTAADKLLSRIDENFSQLHPGLPKRVAYMIWRSPWMTVGGDTFISDIVTRIGWKNVFGESGRYPQTTIEELSLLKPDLILLSSEPYPFKVRHGDEFKTLLPDTQVKLVDGELFSWYGSRMLHAAPYLQSLIME